MLPLLYKNYDPKGTLTIISSDPPFVEWRFRFTTAPFKPLTDQGCRNYPYYSAETLVIVEDFLFDEIIIFANVYIQNSTKIKIFGNDFL